MQRILVLSVIAAILLAGVPALAQSAACNQEMLRGVWCATCTGFTDLNKFDPRVPKGTLVPITMLLRHVINADGKGTGKGAGSLAGTIGSIEMDDTFTVNPGCTGEKTYTLKIKDLGVSAAGKAAVIIMPGGQELRVVIQTPGDVVSCKWEKMFQHTLID